jgi:hypothetical protein
MIGILDFGRKGSFNLAAFYATGGYASVMQTLTNR